MKRLIFSAAMLTALVGCQKDQMVGDLSSSASFNELYFTTSSQKATKSAVDKDAASFNEGTTTDNEFGVIIYTSFDQWFGNPKNYYAFAEGEKGADNALTSGAPYNTLDALFKTDAYVSKITNTGDLGSAWRIGGETSYWPTEKSLALNVFAYTPHSSTTVKSRWDDTTDITPVNTPTVNGTEQMTIEDFDNTSGEVNLMWSISTDNKREITDGYVTGKNVIALNFHRALSQVRFNIGLAEAKSGDNTTTMVKTTDIVDATKAAEYTKTDLLFPKAADNQEAYVYSGADVYLQSIKICNIPTKGDCVASMTANDNTQTTTNADDTKWVKANTIADFTIYKNSNYAPATYVPSFTVSDADAANLKLGKLLTTLKEGDQAVDNYGWAATPNALVGDEVANPFFRPLLISPFASYTTYADGVLTAGTTIADTVKNAIDLNKIEAGTDNTQPYIEVVFYVQGNKDAASTATDEHRELAVVRKPLQSYLAPNTRVTYNLSVELSILEFNPTVEALVDEAEMNSDQTDNEDTIKGDEI